MQNVKGGSHGREPHFLRAHRLLIRLTLSGVKDPRASRVLFLSIKCER